MSPQFTAVGYGVVVPPREVQAVREFFMKRPIEDRVVASFVGQVCGLGVMATIRALVYLMEQGEVQAHEDRNRLYWTFSRGRRPA